PLAISSSTSAIRSTGGQLRLLAFGDMALLPEGRPSVGGWPALLGGLEALLESADIRIANLESVLTVRTTPSGSIGGFLRADPEAVGALTNAGMDVVTCANNHCLDFGPEALAESVETLRQSGIAS